MIALACKKSYPVYLDEVAEIFDLICVSAGMRGILIELNPADYLWAVNVILAAIS